MPEISVTGTIGGKEFVLSTGKLAGQADGAVVARLGGTEMLVTATANRKMREGVDFFPLTVDFEERMYSVGKIPGSFFRREGRPSEQAILTCRLIDRPLRPSFSDNYRNETHVVITSLAVDQENPFDVVALNGASAALSVSPIPFQGPIGGVRLGLKKGEWIPFPTHADLDESVFELVVAGGRNAEGGIDIIMVEAGSTPNGLRLIAAGDAPSDEATVARGLEEAKTYIGEFIDLQNELASQVTKKEVEWPRRHRLHRRDLPEGRGSRRARSSARWSPSPTSRSATPPRTRSWRRCVAELGLAEDDDEGRGQAKQRLQVGPQGPDAQAGGRGRHSSRWAWPHRHPADQRRGRRGGEDSWFRSLPTRRDPGPQPDHARDDEDGADAGHPRPRGFQALHAPLQLPAFLHR